MQKNFFSAYLVIFLVLIAVMSLSRPIADNIRGAFNTFISPIVQFIDQAKQSLQSPTIEMTKKSKKKAEILQLQTDNQLLHNEINYLTQLLNENSLLHAQTQNLCESDQFYHPHLKNFHSILNQLNWRLEAIPARIIFRGFDTWNSSLWIDIGNQTNSHLAQPVVAKNSPVIVGQDIIGVIDYVGKYRSRVNLITDRKLKVSVRVARDMQKKNGFSQSYFAKGEISGYPSVSRDASKARLIGTGFNCDFADQKGEARDLRNGKLLIAPQEMGIPILKNGDLLITTGYDGLFPEGFHAAIVTQVEPLKEGDFFYTVQCRPSLTSFEELSLVFVLPPLMHVENES